MDNKELEKIRKEFKEYMEFIKDINHLLESLTVNLYHKQWEHNKRLEEIVKVLEEINKSEEEIKVGGTDKTNN